ncbi:hypothetical protein [Mesorhizobium sp. WSM2239]|uniref:Uncharacterized protein n=2 Tax=unclassified Mesorhizobium TaxID=325217 RepID=A0AAU8DGM3_9HYPH
MTPNPEKRKYDVTVVETNVHTFTVEIPNDVAEEDRAEFVEQIFCDTLPDDLENHNWFIPDREVENVTPQ